MNQKDLAKKMKLTPSQLSTLLNGRDGRPGVLQKAYRRAKELEGHTGIPWTVWVEGYQLIGGEIVLLRTLLRDSGVERHAN